VVGVVAVLAGIAIAARAPKVPEAGHA